MSENLFDLPESEPSELELASLDLSDALLAYHEARPDGLDNAPVVKARDVLVRARNRVANAEREALNRLRRA